MPAGTIIGGKYQILKLIGKGGMAHVYQAYDIRLDLKVAIKMVSPELLQTMDEAKRQAVLQRFEAEAQIAAKLDHPNIIRIYGIYRETIELDGTPHEIDYLAMELLAGRTLRNTMDVSGFEHEEKIRTWIAKFMVPILDGHQKVHESGIIHRDIKPENFVLKEDVPKLADIYAILTVPAFYISHTPVTNQQFVNFLNANIEPVTVTEGDVFLNERLVLKISEKIRGYKPIGIEDRRFVVKNPMHSSCAVLLVTGYGPRRMPPSIKRACPGPRNGST